MHTGACAKNACPPPLQLREENEELKQELKLLKSKLGQGSTTSIQSVTPRLNAVEVP